MDNGHVRLHKVLGTTVEAIAGGVYHRFVRPPFSLTPHPLRFTALPSRLSVFSRERQKHTNSSIILPYPSPSLHLLERHAPRRPRWIPLTGYLTVQERERRRKPLIIPIYSKVIMYVLPPSFVFHAPFWVFLWFCLSSGRRY